MDEEWQLDILSRKLDVKENDWDEPEAMRRAAAAKAKL